jgi:hypothetical protein
VILGVLLATQLASFADGKKAALDDNGLDGLIVHYIPSREEPGKLIDRTGNGHDAVLKGGAFIDSPRGTAVRFDGKDDYAVLPALPLPNESDLTIEMWLRCDQTANIRRTKALQVFGDPARLSIDRTFSIRIHPSRHFYMEYGDGTHHGTAYPDRSFLLHGKDWQHLAVLIDDGYVHYYLDGEHYGGDKLAQPLNHQRGAPLQIAGWPFGYADMDLDEMRIYNRALSEQELFGETVVKRRTGPGDLKVRQSVADGSAYADLRLWTVPDDDVTLALIPKSDRHTPIPNAEPIRHLVRTADLNSVTGRFQVTPEIGSGLERGWYEVRACVRLGGREYVLSETIELGDLWLHTDLGKELKVMWPWTPVRVLEDASTEVGSLTVEVWGRQYRFGPGGLIEGVSSRERSLLRGPVQLRAQLRQAGIEWKGGHAKLTRSEDAFAEVEQRFTSEQGLTLHVRHRIEFDGFVITGVQLRTDEPVSLERLGIHSHYERQESELFYTWPLKPRDSRDQLSGALEKSRRLPFKPIVFLGSDDAGFAWYFESYRGWSDWKSDGAVTLNPQADGQGSEAIFALRRETTRLQPGQSLEYEFAWQATPVKAMTTTGAEVRSVRINAYTQEIYLPDEQVDGEPALQRYADMGARSIISWQTGNAFSYPIPLGIHKEFGRFVEAAARYDIQVLPYVVGFLISPNAPEYWDHRDALTQIPQRAFTMDTRTNLKDGEYLYASLYGPWPDLMVHRVQELMDTYEKIGGIYLDSTGALFEPGERDLSRGAGWKDDEGTVHPTWPIFRVRDLMRRLYAVVVDADHQRLIDLHLHDTYNPSAMAYASIGWHGEALMHGAVVNLEAFLPDDRVRTEFTGKNVGIPVDMLTHSILRGSGQERLKNYRKLVDYLAPYDIWVRPTGFEQLEYMNQKQPVGSTKIP